MAIICKAKRNLNNYYRETIVLFLRISLLIYCVEIWGRAKQRYIHNLTNIQKKIIRVLTNSKPKSHTEP